MLKEPLLHFLLAAVVLSLAYHFFGRPTVKISAPLLNGLRKDYESAIGRAATPEETDRLAAEYLENEVLFREALRTGLTQDNRVRALLIQTMRTSLRPIVPEPGDEELIALRNETPEIYRFPAKAGFEHVTFADAAAVPSGLLEKLKGGAPAAELGDPGVRLANPLPPTFKPQLDYLFGAEFADRLLRCKPGVWEGPLTSTRGVHFVRVLALEPERDMPMSELRPTLAAKWIARRESAIISQKVAEMTKSYRVTMPVPAKNP